MLRDAWSLVQFLVLVECSELPSVGFGGHGQHPKVWVIIESKGYGYGRFLIIKKTKKKKTKEFCLISFIVKVLLSYEFWFICI